MNLSIFLPAIVGGIKGGLNPCSLANLLLFFLLISRYSYLPENIFFLGIPFCLAAWLVNFKATLGEYDFFLSSKVFVWVAGAFYLAAGIVFFIYGLISFADWARFKKAQNSAVFKIKLPFYINDEAAEKKGLVSKGRKKWSLILLGAVAGYALALLGSFWPPDYKYFTDNFYPVAGGDPAMMLWLFGVYGYFSAAFYLALVLLSCFFVSAYRGRQIKAKPVSFIKIITSACFLSVGMGLTLFIILFQ